MPVANVGVVPRARTQTWSEDDRVELLDGEIVRMSPMGSPHAGCVDRLNALFTRRLGASAIVPVQNPIALDRDSEPQPDRTLLAPRTDFYSAADPQPRVRGSELLS